MFHRPRPADACDNDDGAPYIGGKMQRVGLQGIAGIFSSDTSRARARVISIDKAISSTRIA